MASLPDGIVGTPSSQAAIPLSALSELDSKPDNALTATESARISGLSETLSKTVDHSADTGVSFEALQSITKSAVTRLARSADPDDKNALAAWNAARSKVVADDQAEAAAFEKQQRRKKLGKKIEVGGLVGVGLGVAAAVLSLLVAPVIGTVGIVVAVVSVFVAIFGRSMKEGDRAGYFRTGSAWADNSLDGGGITVIAAPGATVKRDGNRITVTGGSAEQSNTPARESEFWNAWQRLMKRYRTLEEEAAAIRRTTTVTPK